MWPVLLDVAEGVKGPSIFRAIPRAAVMDAILAKADSEAKGRQVLRADYGAFFTENKFGGDKP